MTPEQARMQWRKELTDTDVRALASDYLRGVEDECTEDAFKEYELRFGKYIKGVTAFDSRKQKKGKKRSGSLYA